MSVSGKEGTSFGSPNGRKRRLSSRSCSSNQSFTSSRQTAKSNSSKNSRGKLTAFKRRKLSSDSSSHSSSSPTPTSSITLEPDSLVAQSLSGSSSSTRLSLTDSSSSVSVVPEEPVMAQIPSTNNRTNNSSFSSSKFKRPGGTGSNHKKPGSGKKLSIKSRNGKTCDTGMVRHVTW